MILASEIRAKYLDFFRSKNHAIIPSAPLVPENDPSVLFNTAGMQPLVPYLLWEPHPLGKRLADVQKCVRTGDIDDVGDDTHLTIFEMLGNWSLGDYFKRESIEMSWEFLTSKEWLALDPEMLSVTVFEWDANAPLDTESIEIWKDVWKQNWLDFGDERIAKLPAEDNWWAAGPIGPCGPDTEIFYYMGEWKPPAGSNKWTDSANWMEIWNNVFMQYNRERLDKVILLDGMYCLFDENFVVDEAVLTKIRLFNARIIIVTNAPTEKITSIIEQTGFEFVTYEKNPIKTDSVYFTKMLVEKGLKSEDCIYLDHDNLNLASAKQVEIEGELFENIYSIDKLNKYFYHLLNLPAQCVDTGMGIERCTVTLNGMKSVYETDCFAPVLEKIKEIVGISNYIERSARIIADHLRTATHMIADGVTPKNVDQGYILRRLIRRAIRESYKMWYEKPFAKDIASMYIEQFSPIYESVKTNADKIKLELEIEESKFARTIKQWLKELEKLVQKKKLSPIRKFAWRVTEEMEEQERFPSTQCYNIISGKDAFDIFQTYWFPLEMIQEELGQDGMLVHEEEFKNTFDEEFKKHQELSRTAAAGKFKWGLADDGIETTALHSACHLMLEGLRQILGTHVHQAGSNITAERLRFDFTHPEKMTPEQITKVEDFVNKWISSNLKVTITNMDKNEAQAAWVSGSFWEKYPDIVKVYSMVGADGVVYSRELCGGPHVEHSKDMGRFKIIKEESSSAGVRRIKAVLEK